MIEVFLHTPWLLLWIDEDSMLPRTATYAAEWSRSWALGPWSRETLRFRVGGAATKDTNDARDYTGGQRQSHIYVSKNGQFLDAAVGGIEPHGLPPLSDVLIYERMVKRAAEIPKNESYVRRYSL